MTLIRALLLACLSFFISLTWATEGSRTLGIARAEPLRFALVIGNDRYQHISKLQNARADAQAMGQQLSSLGFRVTLKYDTSEKSLKDALRQFKAKVGPGDIALVFYAGHGVQLGAANYLLPVDINGNSEDQIKDEAIPLQRILDDLQEQKAKFSLVIVDACRNNPFKNSSRALGGRGLAPTTAATGQMVLFSSGAGQEALDRLGPDDKNPNGLFTRVLLKEMQRPGVSVDRVLRNVREEVVRLAKGVGHEQVPALYDQALGDFYFVSGAASPAPAPIPAPSGPLTQPPAPVPAPVETPLTLVVPYAPGGLSDQLARKLVVPLLRQWGGPIRLQNVPGASGTVGYDKVVNARPENPTLLLATAQTLAILPSVFPVDQKTFSPVTQLAPISMVGHSTLVLATHGKHTARTLPALIQQAKKSPGSLRYGSNGVGTFSHLMGALLNEQADIALQHQPYKGQALAISDLLKAEIDLVITEPANIARQISSGEIHLLANAGNQRSANYPKLPTLLELGYAGAPSLNWFGLFAPAGTPATTMKRLQQAFQRAMQDGELKEWMQTVDLTPPPTLGPDYLERRLRLDTAYWGEFIRKTGIRGNQ